MKKIIVFGGLLVSLAGHGQAAPNPQPSIYLDSVKIDLEKVLFSPDKIEAINVVNTDARGEIFIRSKKPKDFFFLTIPDITGKYAKDVHGPMLFMLDNEFVKDISNIRIDSSYLLKVELTSSSDFSYLKNTIPDLEIMKIFTKTKENLDKQQTIRIRGAAITAL